jgi:RNA polymerase sigma factor FliA
MSSVCAENLRYRELWENYWSNRTSGEALRRLMGAFLPLVRKVLRRISIRIPSYVAQEDLLQSALVGLFESIERYNPERPVSFDAFASRRIRGAILDELRKEDFVGRPARSRIKRIANATDELVGELGRAPEEEEISERVGMTLPELRRHMEMAAPTVHLDDAVMTGPDGPVLLKDLLDSNAASPSENAEKSDTLKMLCRAFRMLQDREQKILYLYYHEFLRVKEIAELFGVSEARVCQIHSLALIKLRGIIEDRQT